jgi:hypothetical protein
MVLTFFEEIERVYSNGVTIKYERLNENDIFLHTIKSNIRMQGNATTALKAFLDEFKTFNIYIFSSSELGTDKNILDKWYEKLGFIKTKNQKHIPYNITHILFVNERK